MAWPMTINVCNELDGAGRTLKRAFGSVEYEAYEACCLHCPDSFVLAFRMAWRLTSTPKCNESSVCIPGHIPK